MKRLENIFQQRKKEGRKILSFFLTAGFPSEDETVALVAKIFSAGADIIELGIPFSDPIADGPVIQQSSEIALRNGITVEKIFSLTQKIRTNTSAPIILMGYANPIYAFGIEKFFQHCATFGIDGTIIPDISVEESEQYCTLAKRYSIANIFLATPTTPLQRLKSIDNLSNGFVYAVSLTGVTGVRENVVQEAKEFLQRARKEVVKNPLLAGFGISTPEDARNISRDCDGVIVGSALIKLLMQFPQEQREEKIFLFAQEFRRELDK